MQQGRACPLPPLSCRLLGISAARLRCCYRLLNQRPQLLQCGRQVGRVVLTQLLYQPSELLPTGLLLAGMLHSAQRRLALLVRCRRLAAVVVLQV